MNRIWQLQEAKNKLSEVVDEAIQRPLRLRFTATEIARVVALLRTCRMLDQRHDAPAFGFLTEV